MTNFLRSNVGKKAVSVNYREHVSHKSKLLIDIYKTSILQLDCEKSQFKKIEQLYGQTQKSYWMQF